ncbi:MAG TPA: hypothetical protein PLG50_00950 [bacterium]|nr:hypothetical protein [bacterium]HQG44209.1 hypothetical protein [bacterium]HQI47728.1 hypothetical protein [bacterium]HQJ64089.1 hypothetical protein [bacterium]
MRSIVKMWLCLGALVLLVPGARAQKLEDYLSRYLGDNGKKYLQPLGDAFGANMNSGLYHSAHIPRVGLHLGLDLLIPAALIAEDQRTFTATTEEGFYPVTTREVPTVFGDTQPVSIAGQGGTVYNFPGGYDLSMLPLAIPQVTVGSLLGTELTLRYAVAQLNEDIGDLTLTGIGIRHSVSQYIPLFPIDVSVSYFHQTLKVGDILDAATDVVGVQASKSFSLLTLYGGVAYEKAGMDVSYTHGEGAEAETIAFSLEGQNKMRMTVGANLHLALFQLHADYSLASQNSACLGLYIGL